MKYACMLCALLLGACTVSPKAPIHGEISSLEALELAERGEALIVDVRPDPEREGADLSRLISLPFGPAPFSSRPITPKEGSRFVNAIRSWSAGTKHIILLCQYGVRSKEAQRLLARHGIASASIAGGWKGAGEFVGLKGWVE